MRLELIVGRLVKQTLFSLKDSFLSIRTAPIKRLSESAFGNMPMTFDLLLSSVLSRSM